MRAVKTYTGVQNDELSRQHTRSYCCTRLYTSLRVHARTYQFCGGDRDDLNISASRYLEIPLVRLVRLVRLVDPRAFGWCVYAPREPGGTRRKLK